MQTPTGADESGQGCGSSDGIAGNITHTDAQPHVADARDYQEQPLQDDTGQAVVSANCCICRSFLEPSTSLLQHYRNVHHFEPNFLCKICNKFFDTDCDLRRHTGAVHKSPVRCLLCERKFLSQPALEAHYRRHSCGMPYHCTTCGTSFRDLDELEHHRGPAGARDQAHYCGRCGRKNAWKYQGGPGQTRTYFCEECGALAFKRLVLCQTCGQLFNGPLLYENHYIHQHTGRHRCHRCDALFDSACAKQAHVESVCGTWQMFTCTVCGRRLQSRDKLSEHQQVHQLLSF
ncbi:zinc finger protein 668-like isoform X2 [Bacillus rossius redtenbacheri]|uniref:zinc finger protein 668-like isoform X2 n=1 Tax=Bacillus rossius redtenbacheri TaxID=93214 RepID=UPI002FDCD572